MFYTIPHYYRAFRCSKGACPDTCCGGWEISIDRAALKNTERKKAPLGPDCETKSTGAENASVSTMDSALF